MAISTRTGHRQENISSRFSIYRILIDVFLTFFPPLGAATSAYCAVAPDVDDFGGRYFSNAHVQPRLGLDFAFGFRFPFLASNAVLENRTRIIETFNRVEQLVQPFLDK